MTIPFANLKAPQFCNLTSDFPNIFQPNGYRACTSLNTFPEFLPTSISGNTFHLVPPLEETNVVRAPSALCTRITRAGCRTCCG